MIRLVNHMDRIKILQKLSRYVVFDNRVVENIVKKEREYVYLVIYRLKKAGLIRQIEKGKYTIHNDAFLIASRIVWPSYISCWTALQYYNLTEQLPNVIDIITTRARKRRILKFGKVSIRFIKFRNNNFFGFRKVQYNGFEIFLAEKEKALLDALFLRKIPLKEFSKIIKTTRNKINIRKIRSYAKKMDKKLYMRVKDAI